MEFLSLNKTQLVNLNYSLKSELLRTNRAGSYHCTTISACNTRKYHGLLVSPIEEFDDTRHVLLSALHETIVQHKKHFNLGLHKYAGDHYEPKGHKYLQDFISDPIPKLTYSVGGVVLDKEIIFTKNEHRILIKYTLEKAQSPVKMQFKPFLAFRSIHSLSKANMDVNQTFQQIDNGNSFCMYSAYPDLHLQFSKKPDFIAAPDWYFNIEYMAELRRGYDYKEDLYVPGYYELSLKPGESVIFSAGLDIISPRSLKSKFSKEIALRTPRVSYENCLRNAASQFFVTKKQGTFIYAGYPWLPIRTRDMLISLSGFTLPNDDPDMFHRVMKSVIGLMEGHLLHATPFKRMYADYYPADLPLWLLACLQRFQQRYPETNLWATYKKTLKKIFKGYVNESQHFSIHENGLLYTPASGVPSSWMDSMIDGHPAVERHGYLVETNALWYNALCFMQEICEEKSLQKKIQPLIKKIEMHFESVFWNEDAGYFADCVHENGADCSMRPNQLFAYALPYSCIHRDKAGRMLEQTEQQLLTPKGLRSLSPAHPHYQPTYAGNHNDREFDAYNGSVWPWLFTYYIQARYKIQAKRAIKQAKRFHKTFEKDQKTHGMCSISELFNGAPEHKGEGAISFAMNTAELLYLSWFIEQEELKH